jgi:uncharacterized protein (TIGR02145 family)
MKTTILLIALVLQAIWVFSQPANGINYQSVIRDADGMPLVNTSMTIQVSIVKGNPYGEIVYIENHTMQTNAFGMVSLSIGNGAPQTKNFGTIDWSNDKYFFQLAIDIDNSGSFQAIGESQFLDVPYALNAKSLTLTDEKGNRWNVRVDTLGNLVPQLNEWQCGFPFYDSRDGQTYGTLLLGTQCWMTQNLNVGELAEANIPQSDNGIIEKYCWDNLEHFCTTYGGLYQWDEMMQYTQEQGAEGICPPDGDWRIPDNADWQELITMLGDSSIAGGKMKSTGTIEDSTGMWHAPNLGATNLSGFTGLPSGYTGYDGMFYNLSYYAYFWTSDEFSPGNAWSRGLSYLGTTFTKSGSAKFAGFSVRCVKSTVNQSELPEVLTLPVYNITATKASGGGEVISEGTAAVTLRGLCWSSTQLPTVEHNDGITEEGGGLGKFFSELEGLNPGTNYNVRAYAQNDIGTAYGEVVSFTTGQDGLPCPGMPTIADVQGNIYNTVMIGEQCWMKESLRTGTMISGAVNQTDNGILEKHCYNDNALNCLVYGGLYQWDEMMEYNTTSGAKGICPQGWHVPTDNDLKLLESGADSFYGFGHPVWDGAGWRGLDAGKNLKSTNQWLSNGNGTDLYGFRALPAGVRLENGTFNGLGEIIAIWTSSTPDEGKAWNRKLSYDQDLIGRFQSSGTTAMSVRCVRDAN